MVGPPPAAVRLEGVSFETDVIMLVMNHSRASRLRSGQPALGGEGADLRFWSRDRNERPRATPAAGPQTSIGSV